MTMWCMPFSRWVPKDIYTPSEYVIFITYPLQKWLHERALKLRYTYIGCLFHFSFDLDTTNVVLHNRQKDSVP
jgi:hypothetical protein